MVCWGGGSGDVWVWNGKEVSVDFVLIGCIFKLGGVECCWIIYI